MGDGVGEWMPSMTVKTKAVSQPHDQDLSLTAPCPARCREFQQAQLRHRAEQARLEEEEALLDMLRAEMEAQRAQRAAEEQAARRDRQRLELLDAARYAERLKVRQGVAPSW